jgi:cytochrome c peroxidase
LLGCGHRTDDVFCDSSGCFFTEGEWERVASLSPLLDPPPDPSNRLLGNDKVIQEKAIQLGWQLYFDTDMSGTASWVDMLERPTFTARAAKGTPIKVSCATCHDPAHAGTDVTSVPGHVSVGAGWYDVNSMQTVNAAYYKLLYWNGRSDSLWAQAAAVIESKVSMNGSRMAVLWHVADKYRTDYEAIFGKAALPMTGSSADVKPLLNKDMDGKLLATCTGSPPNCPDGCQVVSNNSTNPATRIDACMPRFPLAGKPGKPGEQDCQPGAEPLGDAYDCMPEIDRTSVNEAYVNVVKAIGAYEYQLRSRNAPFDKFVAAGPSSTLISDGARRGLKLFVGRASCIDCHNTPLLSDNKFHDIGVPQTGLAVPTEGDCPAGNPNCDCKNGNQCLPWGAFDGLTKLGSAKFRRDKAKPISDDPDGGASYAALYKAPSDAMKGAWRTPSLRDVALTAPYMHDGVYRTLDEVIWHYNMGGSAGTPSSHNKAPELKRLFLSDRDRSDLVEFLQTLTGEYDNPKLHVPPPGTKP